MLGLVVVPQPGDEESPENPKELEGKFQATPQHPSNMGVERCFWMFLDVFGFTVFYQFYLLMFMVFYGVLLVGFWGLSMMIPAGVLAGEALATNLHRRGFR